MKSIFSLTKVSAVVICSFALGACVSTGGDSKSERKAYPFYKAEVVEEVSPEIQAEAGLTPRERLAKAIKSLENGSSEIALAELNAYSKAIPNSSRAANLIRQITVDSDEFYPSDFFTISLKSGQSLSTLAKKYLGSAWEFYALSKYNNIDNPSRVNIGTEIKIPLTQLARTVKAKEDAPIAAVPQELASSPKPEDTADVVQDVEVQSSELENSDIEMSDEFAMPITASEVMEEEIDDAESLMQTLYESNADGDYASSVETLASLSTLGELSKEAKELAVLAYQNHASVIVDDQPSESGELFFQAGQLYLEADDEMNAFKSFKQAYEADISNTQARDSMTELQTKIAEQYHREASTAFRKQELSEAIEKWDVVLFVDPTHSNALAYRTQAIELQERLNKLKDN